MEIKEIGKFHDLDANGFILNSSIYPIVQKEYEEPIHLTIKYLNEKISDNIHSIYLRGSVAKGIAVHGISDIDLIVLVGKSITSEIKIFLYKDLEKQVCKNFPFIKGIECHDQSLESLNKASVQFMFKTQCVCIYGEDIIPDLPKFKIDKNAISHSRSLAKDIQDTLEGNHSCGWIMKRIVRVGLEICMLEEQVYTRDLYPCYKVFSKYYPEWQAIMTEALGLAIEPTKEKDKIKEVLNSLGSFLVNEAQRKKINEI